MPTYYNEFDPRAAAWLRELMARGLIPEGTVDERSIADVRGSDLAGFVQSHFFSGIAGWARALELAGWPADRPVWTGSCPCQPFSCAGKRKGTSDERHLWPEWFRLIRECRPGIIFGEQVASKDALGWLDGVFADLEGAGYACGAADLCAAGAGEDADGWHYFGDSSEGLGIDDGEWRRIVISAPHIRQRLFWVAVADCKQIDGKPARRLHAESGESSDAGGMADGLGAGLEGHAGHGGSGDEPGRVGAEAAGYAAEGGAVGGVGDAESGGSGTFGADNRQRASSDIGGSSFWSNFDILPFRDGKARRVESGTFPLAARLPARVVRLRGYGNAIDPEIAAEFIRSFLETEAEISAPEILIP